MIQVAQLNFREMEHQICLLGINQTISGLLYAGGMDAPEDGGVLAYGYVDTEGGFTFEILAPAKVEGDKIIPLPGVPDMMVKLRKEQANEASVSVRWWTGRRMRGKSPSSTKRMRHPKMWRPSAVSTSSTTPGILTILTIFSSSS